MFHVSMDTSGTFGIDLAAQPRETAGCMIEWSARGTGYVHCPADRFDDAGLLAQMTRPDYVTKIAIDAPFGWPVTFIEAITAYRVVGAWPDPPGSSLSQKGMRLRATDVVVRERTGITPLSVSTDRIGIVAMRCARLLAAATADLDVALDRSGHGRFVEVYPAAALHQWGLSPKGSADPGTYKGKEPEARARRERIVDSLGRMTSGWLEFPEKSRIVSIESDHCLDAVVSALVARAAESDLLEPVEDDEAAHSEGWIRLPQRGSLARLGSS